MPINDQLEFKNVTDKSSGEVLSDAEIHANTGQPVITVLVQKRDSVNDEGEDSQEVTSIEIMRNNLENDIELLGLLDIMIDSIVQDIRGG